jgi:hypothetical protein
MNPNRLVAFSVLNEFHLITFSLRIEVSFSSGTIAYSPLSFCGPSTSRPMVLPSVENEWQFAQVGKPAIRARLPGAPMSFSRQVMSLVADSGRGLITPRSPCTIISGTSR